MSLRRVLVVSALALGFLASGLVGPVGPGQVAEVAAKSASSGTKTKAKARGKAAKGKGKTAKKSRASSRRGQVRSNRTSGKVKLCKDVTVRKGKKTRTKKKCSFVKEFQGHAAGALETGELAKPSGQLWLKSNNLQEELRVQIYKADGTYDEAALAQLDNIFRCKRTQEVRAMDPRLYEQLSRIQDNFAGKQIEVVSGFRFAERSSSRHYHASAMDIRVIGASLREMYAYAQTLDRGGMGMGVYPHSGFIHVDYRAPGEPSYRWTDYSGPGGGKKAKKGKQKPGRTARAKRPTS
ncbi:MAG: DUF882 domain-containing protein [Kofleriaceae bacterium]